MTGKQFIQPEGLSNPGGYTHVVAVSSSQMVYISGQVAYDVNFQLVGQNDLEVQARQVMVNLGTALASVGASFADVVKFTIFVVDYQASDRDIITSVRDEFISAETPPASTLVGVQALARPELLIEIEAIAALP